MSTVGTCPRCGEECVIRHCENAPPDFLCSCRHPDAERDRGEQAIRQAGENAPADWLIEAFGTVRLLAETQAKFTADDVWRMVGAPPEPRALGAIMRQAKREQLCEPTDMFVTSERRHGAPIRVWRSLLFGGRAITDCLQCGGSLEGLRPEAKFDTDICRAAWHREHQQEAA